MRLTDADVTALPPDLAAIFAPDGPLAQAFPDFVPRAGQMAMAAAVAEAIASRALLLAEAGTGTGKTFAYLIPALRSGVKTIVATASKTLQDQLFCRDLPQLVAALRLPVKTALLKGRSNYVCWLHLERHLDSGYFSSPEEVIDLRAIRRFALASPTGDRSSCAEVAEGASAWLLATSTRENCLGNRCPFFDRCFVYRARQQAQAAELVVVNHALFFADQALREEGVEGLLPQTDLVVFDEAHHLPALIPHYYGQRLSVGEALQLVRDLRLELLTTARDFPDGLRRLDHFEQAVLAVRAHAVGEVPLRTTLADLSNGALLRADVAAWQQAAEALAEALVTQAERSELLTKFAERLTEQAEALCRWLDAPGKEEVVWLEIGGNRLVLYATPLSAAPVFARLVASTSAAWVFTSATLTLAGRFDHFRAQMGLEATGRPILEGRWESPFDYRSRALFLIPEAIPEPHDPGHRVAVVGTVRQLATAAGGRTMVLCTSHAAMRVIAAELREQGGCDGKPFTVLLQGEGPRHWLLEQFRTTYRAVLVATSSFWEGVDVVGAALSVVVIDKLPFASPDEPLLAAQIARMRAQGEDPFRQVQLPQAAVALQQGAGRLIRSENDFGVLCICDPRLVSRSYGKLLWSSLPPFRPTRSIAKAETFLRQRLASPFPA